MLSGCVLERGSELDEDTRQIGEALFVNDNVTWKQLKIPVCWEPEGVTDANAVQRRWVQEAVRSTWEANSRVRFTGWGTCTKTSDGVRIFAKEGTPLDPALDFTSGIGRLLDAKPNGVQLNLTYTLTGGTCKDLQLNDNPLETCVKAEAVHEFGHVLGFVHEMERAENNTSTECFRLPGDSGATTRVGAFDDGSIMIVSELGFP